MQTTLDLRPPQDDAEQAQFGDLMYQCFAGFGGPRARTDWWINHIGRDCLRVGWRDGRMVCGLGFLRFGHYFGGRVVTAAGITAVGVAPDLRGSGVGSTMIRTLVVQLAESGLALSSLYPSTFGVYRKAGYEPAGVRLMRKVEVSSLRMRDYTLKLRPAQVSDHEGIAKLHEHCGRRAAGVVARGERDWQRIFDGAHEPTYTCVVEADSAGAALPIAGYVVYNQRGEARHAYDLHIRDWAAATPAAARRLLTHLSDHTMIAQHAHIESALVDPVFCHARESWCEFSHCSFWMLRMLDVRKAIAQRGYAPGVRGEVALEIEDDLLPHNRGRFTLRVRDGAGELAPGGDGRVKVHIRGLAPLFSGFRTAEEIADTGLLSGPDAELAALSATFAGPQPWMNDRF